MFYFFLAARNVGDGLNWIYRKKSDCINSEGQHSRYLLRKKVLIMTLFHQNRILSSSLRTLYHFIKYYFENTFKTE